MICEMSYHPRARNLPDSREGKILGHFEDLEDLDSQKCRKIMRGPDGSAAVTPSITTTLGTQARGTCVRDPADL